jgi:hypothetical protein
MAISRNKEIRTYSDMLKYGYVWSESGTCCACHKWGMKVWHLSTRANICRECCEKKGDKVLGSVAKAERSVKRWIKGGSYEPKDAKWLSGITGASIEFVQAEMRKVQSCQKPA